jgi:hypothetical protein
MWGEISMTKVMPGLQALIGVSPRVWRGQL